MTNIDNFYSYNKNNNYLESSKILLNELKNEKNSLEKFIINNKRFFEKRKLEYVINLFSQFSLAMENFTKVIEKFPKANQLKPIENIILSKNYAQDKKQLDALLLELEIEEQEFINQLNNRIKKIEFLHNSYENFEITNRKNRVANILNDFNI